MIAVVLAVDNKTDGKNLDIVLLYQLCRKTAGAVGYDLVFSY